MSPPTRVGLREVVNYLMGILTAMARRKDWGSITILVQDGQVVGVDENRTYRGRLPDHPETRIAALPAKDKVE